MKFMIWECMEVFQRELERTKGELILDNYLPKDGTYLMVEMSESEWKQKEPVIIQYDKRNDKILGQMNQYYKDVCFLDYCSKLIDMNKPMDAKKIIHSNNYLSFFVKKENLFNGKLTAEIIDGYYKILADPYLKYKTGKVKELYAETESLCGKVDMELLERIHSWIRKNVFQILEETKEKDYLKIFFIFPDKEKTEKIYQQEGNRYLLPNIYNNNKYNEKIGNEIYGLPNNNLQLNDKKPYLPNHSRRKKVPFLLNREDVLIQAKFYDYLEGHAAKGRYNIYFDMEEKQIYALKNGEHPPSGISGYYLRLKKGKEVEIHSADTVVYYNANMKPEFYYRQFIHTEKSDLYGVINKKAVLESLIDEVFFSKSLINNYFTKIEELNITDRIILQQVVAVRERLFSWFHKDTDLDVKAMLHRCGWTLILNSVRKGYWNKSRDQINLIWSLEDYFNQEQGRTEDMREYEEQLFKHIESEDWDFTDNKEFYFAVGQLIAYYNSKSKAYKKNLSAVNAFLDAKNIQTIKTKLMVMFRKYSYDILVSDRRAKSLITHVMGYTPTGTVDKEMIVTGITANSLIYRKKEEEK